MAITTKLATRYWTKTVIMAVVCLVLGLWGIWDYVVAIPNATEGAARYEILRIVKNGLDSTSNSKERLEAVALLKSSPISNKPTEQEWSNNLFLMQEALEGGAIETQRKALAKVEDGLKQYSHVIAPSKYDRPMQWMFILCLPFGFYYLFKYFKMVRRAKIYCLDDEGRLTTPEGSWPAEEILDINMDTWISKTAKARATWMATVTVSGNASVVLDDYVYQDMYLIIGKLAHLHYPDEWTSLARRVKVEHAKEDEKTPSFGFNEEEGKDE